MIFNGHKNWNFTWKYGRQLASATSGSTTVTYEYDVDGICQKKQTGSKVHTYTTLDGKVVREDISTGAQIDYFYDNEGKPHKLTVKIGNNTYTGYFETGFYYVSSRYYDPVTGRFINEDTTNVLTVSPISLTDKNLYAYCDNNPIMRKDDGGEFWNIAISIAIGASVNIAATAVAAGVTGQKCDAWDYLMAGISGAGMAIAGLPGASVVSSVVGIANAVYAGVKSKMNGASCGGAIIAGVTAGLCASSSVALAAKMPDMSYAVSGVVDLVFCTGFNSISAATYRGVTPNSADTTTLTVKSVNKSSKKNNYNTKTKKKSKCSAMKTGCSTDYFRYLYNGGMPF